MGVDPAEAVLRLAAGRVPVLLRLGVLLLRVLPLLRLLLRLLQVGPYIIAESFNGHTKKRKNADFIKTGSGQDSSRKAAQEYFLCCDRRLRERWSDIQVRPGAASSRGGAEGGYQPLLG